MRGLPGVMVFFALIILAVTAIFVPVWGSYVGSPWLIGADDHTTLGVLFYQQLQPDFLKNDYMFGQTTYTRFYTPSFTSLIKLVGQLTGTDHYELILQFVSFGLLIVYLPCATLFFQAVLGYLPIGLACAILSIYGINAISDFWAVPRVYPRSIALPVVMLALWAFWRFAGRGASGYWGFLCGVAVGITANLHPTTGIGLALILILACGLSWLRSQAPKPLSFLFFIAGIGLAGLPIALNIFGQPRTTPLLTTFEPFVAAFKHRIVVLPRVPIAGVDTPAHIAQLSAPAQIFVGVGWLPVGLLLWWRGQRRRALALPMLIALLLGLVWLIADSFTVLEFVLVCGSIGIYLMWWWQNPPENSAELRLIELLMSLMAVSLTLSIALHFFWETFQIWQLTMFVAELPRASRLATPLLYAFLGLILVRGLPASVRWLTTNTSSIYRRLPNRLQTARWFSAGVFMVLSSAVCYAIWRWIIYTPFYVPLLIGAIVGLAYWRYQHRQIAQAWIIFCAGGVGIALLMMVLQTPIFGVTMAYYALVAAGTLWAAQSWAAPRRRLLALVGAALLFGVSIIVEGNKIEDKRSNTDWAPALAQAGEWARQMTPTDAIFYYAKPVGYSYDMSQFRFYSRRAVTHSYKDVNLVAYSYPDHLSWYMQRLLDIGQANLSAGSALLMAQEFNADFIIAPNDAPILSLNLPEVYRNPAVVILDVPEK